MVEGKVKGNGSGKRFFELVQKKMSEKNTGESHYWMRVKEVLGKEEVMSLWKLERMMEKEGLSHQLSVRYYRYRAKGKKEKGKHGVVVFRIKGKVMVTTVEHLSEIKELEGLEGYWVF